MAYCAPCVEILPILATTSYADLSLLCGRCRYIFNSDKSPSGTKQQSCGSSSTPPIYYIRLYDFPPSTLGSLVHSFNRTAKSASEILTRKWKVKAFRIYHLDYSTEMMISFRDPWHAARVLKVVEGGLMMRIGRGNWADVKGVKMSEEDVVEFIRKQSESVVHSTWQSTHRRKMECVLDENVANKAKWSEEARNRREADKGKRLMGLKRREGMVLAPKGGCDDADMPVSER